MSKSLATIIAASALSAAILLQPLQTDATHKVYDCNKDLPNVVRKLNEYDKLEKETDVPIFWIIKYHKEVSSDYINCMQNGIQKNTIGKYTFEKFDEDNEWIYYQFKRAVQQKS